MQKATLATVLSVVAAACAPPPMTLPPQMAELPSDSLRVQVEVDREREEVVVYAGPFRVEAIDPGAHVETGGHADHLRSPLIEFEWPVDAYFRGFEITAVGPDNETFPSSLMHHLIGVNFERRQLVYPVAERLFGVGTETSDVVLPKTLGVPVERGSRLAFYASWHNDFGYDLEKVYIRVALPYMEEEPRVAVLPIYMDTNNQIGGSNAFDVPPGVFEKSHEFEVPVDGRIVAAGGHMHDYGVELRLEDVATGEVLMRVEPDVDEEGRVHGIKRQIFGAFGDDLRLVKGRRYRVVGRYDNPTGETLTMGAMAHISGIFAPDDPSAVPALDDTTPLYAQDVAALPPRPGEGARHGEHGHH